MESVDMKKAGFSKAIRVINGKYKLSIIYYLSRDGVIRFNEFKRLLGKISFKTLSLTLKELESDGMIHREEYPQIPPKVEYSLTELGMTFVPVMKTLCAWGDRLDPKIGDDD